MKVSSRKGRGRLKGLGLAAVFWISGCAVYRKDDSSFGVAYAEELPLYLKIGAAILAIALLGALLYAASD